MANKQELKEEFWSALSSDMTMMLGLVGVEDSHARPMTAQMKGKNGGPIWFFTAKDTSLVKNLNRGGARAIGTFASKGHDLFATVHGKLSLDNDPKTIDELWNMFVAAWYEEGKDDPKLALIRFDPEKAEIWRNGNSLVAGLMVLFGSDPKRDYKDNVAEVKL